MKYVVVQKIKAFGLQSGDIFEDIDGMPGCLARTYKTGNKIIVPTYIIESHPDWFRKIHSPEDPEIGVHLNHCYQGENEDGCKYGDKKCPAKPKETPCREMADCDCECCDIDEECCPEKDEPENYSYLKDKEVEAKQSLSGLMVATNAFNEGKMTEEQYAAVFNAHIDFLNEIEEYIKTERRF